MEKYIRLIYKIKKPLMIVFIMLNLFAIFGITQIKIKTDFDVFKTQDSKYIKNQEILETYFPDSDQMIVVTEYNEEIKDKILDFQQKASDLPGIKFVKGIEEDALELPFVIEELSPIKTVNDETYAVLSIFPNDQFDFSQLKQIEQYLEDDGITYYISGDKYMQNKIFDYLILILLAIIPLVIFILFNIFRFQMKSVKATILSVLPAIIAALWMLGFAGILGNEVSILTVLAPIFTIIIGSADGLHFISHVQEYLDEKNSMKTSIGKALSMVGVPMIITTITSVAGFIALLFMNTKAIHDLAIYASIGITLAGIITWIILPAICSFEKIDIRKKSTKHDIKLPFKKLVGWPSFVIVGLIIVSAFWGIPKLKTEFNQLMMYKKSTVVSKSFEKIMSVNEGTIPLFALIENNNLPLDKQVTDKVDDFSNALLDSGNATKVISFYNVLDTIKEQMPGNMPLDIDRLSSLDIYDELISEKYSKIIVFPKDLSNQTIESIVSIAGDHDHILLSGLNL